MTPKKAGPISNVVCPGCRRTLDDVVESLIRQRGKFKGQREQSRAELIALREGHEEIDQTRQQIHIDDQAEVERLREAYEALARGRDAQWDQQVAEVERLRAALEYAKGQFHMLDCEDGYERASRALDEGEETR